MSAVQTVRAHKRVVARGPTMDDKLHRRLAKEIGYRKRRPRKLRSTAALAGRG